jgi:hypothetical protein
MDKTGLKLGLLAGLVGISCCVSPVVMVLLGLASVSFAISLGNTLYYGYGWYFRGAALILAAVGVFGVLRGRHACSLRGARAQWRLLLTVVISMVVVYVSLYWLTSYLASSASRHAPDCLMKGGRSVACLVGIKVVAACLTGRGAASRSLNSGGDLRRATPKTGRACTV